jgi:hypothetical protein
MLKRTVRHVATLSAVAALAGCGRQGRLPLVPAAGQVSWAGRPLAGARVVLVPLGPDAAGRPRPAALSGPDGIFRLSTYAKEDGAPAGQYAVAVTWGGPHAAGSAASPLALSAAPDYFRGRYGDPKTSGLRLTVGPGGELTPINLR